MIRRTLALFIASASLVWASPVFAADRYELDPAHSTIGFSIKHLLISRVQGRFTDVAGVILYDESDITKSSVDVAIKTGSINTQVEKRDAHLKSPDFFDAEKFPMITFKSSRVEKTGDGYLCVGTLTMHGVSKELSIPFEITGKVKDPQGNTRIGVDAELSLNRQDYGISWNKAMEGGGLLVGNDVKITLSVEAVKKP